MSVVVATGQVAVLQGDQKEFTCNVKFTARYVETYSANVSITQVAHLLFFSAPVMSISSYSWIFFYIYVYILCLFWCFGILEMLIKHHCGVIVFPVRNVM